ncbi:ROK family transcriptional regulator [Cellulomonas sp. KRMCY2]|uniref:ROK family transcriptional regulator n=1 Tax=Cellulomonas sp. KRMCY2 TaxID=1304865 RepID=UPI00045E9B18|nr:ROK family transcriptional regulator [Cellulomonas sp. KRMCY2]
MADPSESGPEPPAHNPGSQTALRGRNVRRVMETLIARGSSTQAELSRHTGLSKATVSNIVGVLARGGYVATSPTTSSGRRAVMVRLEGRGAVAVGIDIGRRHVRVVLASLARQVVAEREIPLPLGHRGEAGIEAAADVLEMLLADNGVERRAVLGVGVGIPGPIDRRTGTVAEGAILPQWVGLNVLRAIEDRLHLPVFIDNDANLGALAQVTWGPHAGVEDMVYLKIGTGIGCGLIIGGTPYYGHAGTAGEIGHSPITDSGPLCRCGNRGCLELAASTSVMIDALGRGRSTPITTDDIVRDALAGDTATLRVIEDAGLAAGKALAGVANLVNPELIVVGGPLAGLGEILLDPIRRGLLRYAMPLAGERTTVTVSSLGDRAEALGAAALVIRNVDLPAALALL